VFPRGNQAICSPLLQGTEADSFCKICPWLASILLSLKRVLRCSVLLKRVLEGGKGDKYLKDLKRGGEISRDRKGEGSSWVLR